MIYFVNLSLSMKRLRVGFPRDIMSILVLIVYDMTNVVVAYLLSSC